MIFNSLFHKLNLSVNMWATRHHWVTQMDIKVIYSLFNIKNKYYEHKQFPIVKLIKLYIIHKEPKLASPYTTLPKSYITVKAKLLYNNCIFFIKCIINIPSFEYTLECFSNILFSLLFLKKISNNNSYFNYRIIWNLNFGE